jgi:quinoprotein dehydrogenase-associated probable ABC transporter substrate-binding protein
MAYGASLIAAAILTMPAESLEREAFRVCADPNNLPFSHRSLQGFENKLAELWAERLGLDVQYTWFPQRIGFVRNTLRSKNENDEYKCDVVMGVAQGFDQLMTTKPYYRSTYALVYVKGRDLDDVATAGDFLNLPDERKAHLRIAAFDQTPGPLWLAHHRLLRQMVPYPAMSGDPAAYPGEILEQALTEDQVDAAIIWGPIAGYFAKRAEQVDMVLVPLHSEPGVQMDYAISAGVRHGDDAGKAELEQLIDRTSGEIRALLESYNVPLLAIGTAAATPQDDDRD